MPTYGLNALAANQKPQTPEEIRRRMQEGDAASFRGPQPSIPQRAGAQTPGSAAVNWQQAAFNDNATWPSPPPMQSPGNNFYNPGYGEQAFEYTQNRLLEDPYAAFMQQSAQGTRNPSQGEQYINQNLGTLNGPGSGEQYWNQMQGQYMDPFAGEQFARQATQQFSPQGQAGGFYDQAMGQYGDFTGYSGPQNAQGQYGQSSGQLAGGTAGENYLQQLAGGYGQNGQYTGDNLAAGQYAQTQQAFGDLPIANFDPFYDRAIQLGTQDYNRQTASRGVYGSSEALSGVGNIITDLNAQRANRSFDAEMQRAQEQRARQELLGNQARMGDLSSLAAFQSNLQGVQTYGNLGQAMGQLELDRHQTLGNMANQADTQALGAQNANIAGLNAYGQLANNADVNATRRYEASTNAMNQADRTQLDRMNSGAEQAFRTDDQRRQDYEAEVRAAETGARLGLDRNQQGAEIATNASQQDLARLNSFNNTAQGAESQRQQRLNTTVNAISGYGQQVQSAVSNALNGVNTGEYSSAQDAWQMEILPALQAANMSQQDMDRIWKLVEGTFNVATSR